MVSDLDLVNSKYYEEHLYTCDPDEPNVSIEIDHFVLTQSEGKDFEDGVCTSSFLIELTIFFLKTFSILIPSTKDSTAYEALRPDLFYTCE